MDLGGEFLGVEHGLVIEVLHNAQLLAGNLLLREILVSQLAHQGGVLYVGFCYVLKLPFSFESDLFVLLDQASVICLQ